ncbi:MAG: hypothetical protein GXO26_01425 [Crenarchaeota archaeon]|nr:hypothetical protein [Thermoproteota archaeon]
MFLFFNIVKVRVILFDKYFVNGLQVLSYGYSNIANMFLKVLHELKRIEFR